MLEENGLRGKEARKKQKSSKNGQRTPDFEHPPALGSSGAARGRPKSNTEFFSHEGNEVHKGGRQHARMEDRGWKNLAERGTADGGGRNLAAKRRKELKKNVNAERPTLNAEIRTGGGMGVMEYWSNGTGRVEGGKIGAAGLAASFSKRHNPTPFFRKYDNLIN
jgi:hypothetical protein